MTTIRMPYDDTFYDSRIPDEITRGKTVRQGSAVEVIGFDGTHTFVTYTDHNGDRWFKAIYYTPTTDTEGS